MLFNSYIFIFLFLPATLLGFHLIGTRGHQRIAIGWLVVTSLFFYGWWNPTYLGLILVSIFFNYAFALALENKPRKIILAVGIAINLGLLGYFKYANFFVDSLNSAIGSDLVLHKIVLPLAISFFTFQQIAFLVDAHRGETREHNFLHYCLFVTFFPQLIAGPIVHHKEVLPQFARESLYRLKSDHMSIGVTIFLIGLFKKVVLADGIALHATPVFDAAGSGSAITFFEAWGGALAYTFQLYFDFCGYSEMAIGSARMFGVVLPLNFFSPYKANNIIDFWRRWHITLSRFLRDYLYFPLGGNRKGPFRRYVNLAITMLLGGLWHGAAWSFVIWGGLHGLYLIVNHAWHAVKRLWYGDTPAPTGRFGHGVGRLITFLAVVVAWVVFRSESIDGAINMYEGMLGLNGFSFPGSFASLVPALNEFFPNSHIVANGLGTFGSSYDVASLIVLLVIVWFAPNTIELMSGHKPAIGLSGFPIQRRIEWRPNLAWSILLAVIATVAVSSLGTTSEFLYFQF